jgi:ATP-dependent Zn protease
MSDNLGPLTYGKKEEQIFLGREISQHRITVNSQHSGSTRR